MNENNKLEATTFCNNLKITFQSKNDFSGCIFKTSIHPCFKLFSLGLHYALGRLFHTLLVTVNFIALLEIQTPTSVLCTCGSTFHPSWYLITCSLALALGNNFTPSAIWFLVGKILFHNFKFHII